MRKPIDDQQNDDLGALHELVDAARDDMPTDVQWQSARRNLNLRLEAGQKESIIMSILRSAFSHKIRWAVSALVVVAVVVLVIGLNPFERSSAGVYAAVVERIKKARTMVYKETISIQSPKTTIVMECAFKEPGYVRTTTLNANGTVLNFVISDLGKGKDIVVDPSQKRYLEFVGKQTSSLESALSRIEAIRSFPERAHELWGERTIDAYSCKGFQVTEKGCKKTMWIDVATSEIVMMEMDSINIPGFHVTLTDFKFDIDLEDTLFEMRPPAGYQKQTIRIPRQEPLESNFIFFLRLWTTKAKESKYPDSLYFADILKGIQKVSKPSDTELAEEQRIQLDQKLQSGMQFIMGMQPENDWHYAGRGVKPGETDKAIFWYRPTGSVDYRVIFGDLSVREVSPEKLPSLAQNAESIQQTAGIGSIPSQPVAADTPEKGLVGDRTIEGKVEIAKAALRSMAVASEAYFVDFNRYTRNPNNLTTPVAYGIKVEIDPFSKTGDTLKNAIAASGKLAWYSIGPDDKDDEAKIIYDPTNGAISAGDILREQSAPYVEATPRSAGDNPLQPGAPVAQPAP